MKLRINKLLNLAQLAKTFKKIIFSQKISSFFKQGKRIGITNRNFLLSLYLSVGNDCQISAIEILSAVWLAIMIDIATWRKKSNSNTISLTKKILNSESICRYNIELPHHF